MEQSVIATKLYIPKLRPGLVMRPRLLERLNGGIHARLTLIAAPAGFGKSTLLSQWIEQFGGPVAWLALDPDDNDPIRFWTYAITALRTRLPEIGTQALGLLKTPQPTPLSTILAHLVNDLAQLPGEIVLVLDDYHEISAEPIHESLGYLLDHLPPQFHLILATRMDPPLPLPRLRVRGELTELRAADLRFSESEAGAFFSQAMGLSLTPAQVKTLESRTSNSQYGAEATEEGTKGGGLCRWSKGNQDNGLMWRPPDEKRE
ncbi:MAG: AAA family ATPase, partial [Caldilineaceae bacterium]|nr:AAA family ATPase [Caldilineaceae bacterium]MBP8110202.1 AAA family ATPase [Caldilineaceae bacterium]MBP8125254.1 AAA family ATPase [Caldilineaceae bacterium]MBP9074908.1 AAA family ATPase [Caldilineaceae bacterium]